MRLVILGATGAAGKVLVQQALEAGHQVTAVARSPEKIETKHENLNVTKGNIFNHEELIPIFKDADAILSTLGFPYKPKPVTGYTKTVENAAKAMRAVGCNRLIVVHSWHSKPGTLQYAGFLFRMISWAILQPILDGMYDADLYLEKECDDINYTVVQPPRLLNGPITNKLYQVDSTGEYWVKGAQVEISRNDLARYMLQILNDETTYKKIQAVGLVQD